MAEERSEGHQDHHHAHQHANPHPHVHHHEGEQGDVDESETKMMSFSEKNRAHWNKQAASYMSDHFQKEFGDLINKVTAFIQANITWISPDLMDGVGSTLERGSDGVDDDDERNKKEKRRNVRVLDYACGPGTITAALVGHATEFIGIDLSEKMVDEYNKNFAEHVLREENSNAKARTVVRAHAVVGNLLDPKGPQLPATTIPSQQQQKKEKGKEKEDKDKDISFSNFDLVAVGLGFHHFENLELVMSRLVERIRAGGTLMIVDFLPHAKNDLGDKDSVQIVAHHGFTEDRVCALFEGAGLVNVDVRLMAEPVLLRGKAPRLPFIARGTK